MKAAPISSRIERIGALCFQTMEQPQTPKTAIHLPPVRHENLKRALREVKPLRRELRPFEVFVYARELLRGQA